MGTCKTAVAGGKSLQGVGIKPVALFHKDITSFSYFQGSLKSKLNTFQNKTGVFVLFSLSIK